VCAVMKEGPNGKSYGERHAYLPSHCFHAALVPPARPRAQPKLTTHHSRRAAVSVAANIAEGYGREHTKTFVQFLRVSQGSLKELETHLVIAQQVGLLQSDQARHLLLASDEIGRMLRAFIRSSEKRIENRQ
ncbi:MAG: four helix bundle protein, partial [Hyphomicrobiaceae bacterium]